MRDKDEITYKSLQHWIKVNNLKQVIYQLDDEVEHIRHLHNWGNVITYKYQEPAIKDTPEAERGPGCIW